MTTKSYPYNIVVTRDPLVLNKLFFDKMGRNSFANRFASLDADEKTKALIVSPQSNNNFISLDVNFPDKVSGEGTKYVVLKLLETSKLLEYFNIATEGFTEVMISRAVVKKAVLGPDKVLDDLAKGIRPRFFLSFGMGDDLREWSGPYSLSLIDANISITSDGIRELELMFTPTTNSLTAFTNKLFDDYQYAQKDSVFDSASTRKTIIRTRRKYDLKPTRAQSTAFSAQAPATQPKKDWNYCIRNLVHGFISDRFPSVPTGNVLVLLPDDFNEFLKVANPYGDLIDSNYKEPLKKFAIDISLDKKKALATATDLTPLSSEEYVARGGAMRQVRAMNFQKGLDDTKQIIRSKSAKLKALRAKVDELTRELLETLGSLGSSRELLPAAAIARLDEAEAEFIETQNQKIQAVKKEISDLEFSIDIVTDKITGGEGRANRFNSRSETAARIERARAGQKEGIKTGSVSNKGWLSSRADERTVTGLAFEGRADLGIAPATWAADYRSIVDLYTLPTLNPEDYSKFILSMGGTVDTNYLEEKNTLLTLSPLYRFIEGVNTGKDQIRPKDFTILEENDTKILKLLKDYDLIENAESPVIIFGRLDSIQKWVYPSNTVALDATPLSDNWQRQASPRLWKLTERQEVLLTKKYGPRTRSPIKFYWGSYIPAFIEAFKQKAGFKTSSFGEGFGAYEDPIRELAKNAKTDNPLIFTHNIKNSNVLSLSFDSSPYKGELLNYSTESIYSVVDGVFKPTEGQPPQLLSDNTFLPGPLGKLVRLAAESVAAAKKGTDKIMAIQKALSTKAAGVQLLLLGDATKDVNARTFLDAVMIKAGSAGSIVQEGPAQKNSMSELDTLRKMNKYIINVDIKTLPFFNTFILPGRKCVLFGKPNLIVGASELRGKIETAPAFFTNAYTIIGYKHRITSTDAYSEFKLIQDSYAQGLMFKDLSFAAAFSRQLKLAIEEAGGAPVPPVN